jgi:bacterial/archaeal transporter family-2 protein
MSPISAAVVACLIAGVAGAGQAALAGVLGRRIGVLQATALLALVGWALITVIAVVTSGGASGIASGVRQPLWVWLLPAALGVIVLTTFTFAPPRIGTFATFALLIAGQLGASVAIDSAGLFGVDRVPVTGTRIVGLVLLAAGAALVLRR